MSNIDVFSIPLYYISFKINKETEGVLKEQGFKNIEHFPAINGKKFKKDKLLKDKTISIRSYTDLVSGRDNHSGLPSKGAIGCTLSHALLWEKCVDEDMDYIIIVEEDVLFNSNMKNHIDNIRTTLSKSNGFFVGSNIKDNFFFGTQFCILTKGACDELLKSCFPIDVQTDSYISHLAKTDRISLDGYDMTRQRIDKSSSIQDLCLKCMIPNSNMFYIVILLFILILIIVSTFYIVKYYHLKSQKRV
jgi:GR25 family glycosyltransferase involved in LPS biosynthesis